MIKLPTFQSPPLSPPGWVPRADINIKLVLTAGPFASETMIMILVGGRKRNAQALMAISIVMMRVMIRIPIKKMRKVMKRVEKTNTRMKKKKLTPRAQEEYGKSGPLILRVEGLSLALHLSRAARGL